LDLSTADLSLSFDWFILALRVVFIVLVYFFLYQIARVTIRELVTIGNATSGSAASSPVLPDPSSALEIIDPAESSYAPGVHLPLEHYTTVGRRDDNSMVIDDGFISGAHAEVIFDHGAWWLQDLNSTNGTFVNNQPIQGRIRLTDGDIVQFGRVRLRALI
jgi:pSer/pThr/pTyr-binding forkhead associated (FHA) protein